MYSLIVDWQWPPDIIGAPSTYWKKVTILPQNEVSNSEFSKLELLLILYVRVYL